MVRGSVWSVASLAIAALVLTTVPGAKRSLPAVLTVAARQDTAAHRRLPQDTACKAAPQRWPRVDGAPVFTPYTRAPELLNREVVRRALTTYYPPLLRNAGLGGQTRVWLHIDECGAIADARVKETSGWSLLDAAALRVARLMRFSPGYLDERPVPVWVALPIIFRAPGADSASAARRPLAPDSQAAPLRPDVRTCKALSAPLPPCEDRLADFLAPPDFLPLTIRNVTYLDAQIRTVYAPQLREAGIAGTASIRIAIDPTGHVTAAEVERTSGHDQLDAAALALAREIRFFPPRHRSGRYGSVTIVVPVEF